MFALPGILGLIFFVYVRPQEILLDLQRLPMLYIFFALALFGLAVDIRLRVNKAAPVPQLLWAVLLFLWAVLTMIVKAPETVVRGSLEFAVSVTLFFVIAHSVHTFRALQMVTGLVLGLVIALAVIGVHQGTADYGCVMIDPHEADLSVGTPDGRSCRPLEDLDCYLRGEPEPGADYICERIGLLGTTSVAGRVRYRGVLQDPNELALALSIGVAFAFAFASHQQRAGRGLLIALTLAAVGVCVYLTRSRGGQLVFLSVLGVYAFWRWRWKALTAMVLVGVPTMLVLGGGSSERVDAAASTEERMEAWKTGFDIFFSSPILGVGQGQFVEHHYLTAHNAYVLALAEIGLVGYLLWAAVLYLSVKILVEAIRRYQGVPEAGIALAWGLALLASMAGLCVGVFFLSFAWHMVFWIYIGLVGAYYSAVRTHDPEFRVRMTGTDWLILVGISTCVLTLLRVYLRLKGV
jgi:O-antigen ligase